MAGTQGGQAFVGPVAGPAASVVRPRAGMVDQPIRVRIGPSPTGEPHVGTAYIALFNRAFATQHGGSFVLRIEDTDQTRSRPEWEHDIMKALRWLGLGWDEGPDVGGPVGPYRQSERRAIYAEHVERLLETGHAYRCYATKDELDALRRAQIARKETPRYDRRHRDLSPAEEARFRAEGRPAVVRMKMPLDGTTTFHDQLRGATVFDNAQIDDQVLMKSDGLPTYHLANVVDDHLMGITHVIRAEEWISSTPKHVVLYAMFGWQPPKFVHMPLLRNKDTSKISKRKNPVSILDYQQRGFLPEALVNFLAQQGFTMPDGREVFTFEEFAQALDLDRITLGGPVFDLEKLTWLNGKHLRERTSDDAWITLLREQVFSEELLRKLVPLYRERIDVAEDFIPKADYFFRGEVPLDLELLRPKKRTLQELKQALEAYAERIDQQVAFTAEHLEALSRAFVDEAGWKPRDFFMPLRVAVTGRKASPPLFDVMSVLGRARVRRRLKAANDLLKRAAAEEQRNARKRGSTP